MSGDPASGAPRQHDVLNAFLARHQVGSPEARERLDAATAAVFDAFAAAGVDALLLKGAGLVRLLYRPDEYRGYVDIDVLASPADQAHAADVLRTLSYRNVTAELGIDDIGGVVHADTWLAYGPGTTNPIQVELHRWLPGADAEPDLVWRAVWARRTVIELHDQLVPIPGREIQALQLATHAAQHGPEYLKGVRELTLALERWPGEVWREACGVAREIGATEAFAAGLRLVGRGVELAESLDLPTTDRLDWEVRHLAERPRGTFHLDAFNRTKNWAGRASILRRALLPNRQWLVAEYPWARRGGAALSLAYVLHVLRAPAWAARSWLFRRRRASSG